MPILKIKYPDQAILKQAYDYVDGKLIWKLQGNRHSRDGMLK